MGPSLPKTPGGDDLISDPVVTALYRSHNTSRIPSDNNFLWHILCHHRPCPHNTVVANLNPSQNIGPSSDPYITSDANRSSVGRGLTFVDAVEIGVINRNAISKSTIRTYMDRFRGTNIHAMIEETIISNDQLRL